jgi:pyridoxal phosphate enzyme (YggS family)
MIDLASNLELVQQRIALAVSTNERERSDVQLIAVSKTKPADMVRAGYELGLTDFGENYVQEAVDKVVELADLPICWHFIGPIQSNKTRQIAEHFSWVHTIDRGKIAHRLSEQRPLDLGPLNVLLQVNISGEASKSGVNPDGLLKLAREVLALPNLQLHGLMAIPAPSESVDSQREPFRQLRQLLEQLKSSLGAEGTALRHLSMGMTGDLDAAIAEGATLVRIGTSIFGAREGAREAARTAASNTK